MARIDAQDALPGPSRVLRRLADLRHPRRWAAAAAVLLALGGGIALLRRASPTSAPDAGAGREIALDVAPGVRVLRDGLALEAALELAGTAMVARAGDVLVADRAGVVRVDGRTTIACEPRARLRLGTRDAVEMLDGRATFDVAHDETRPFSVATSSLRVVDRGTRFSVEVSEDPAGQRVLVTVEQGRVDLVPTAGAATASTRALSAGEGLAFVGGRASGAPFSLNARPTLSLEAEDVAPSRDRPVVVRLVFDNPTDGWLVLPAYDPVRAPLHVEVRSPDGGVQAVRVSAAMLVDGGGSGRSLPPRGRVVLRVRFEHTFASPGTYRLRAIYRPAGAVDGGASPELVLPVR